MEYTITKNPQFNSLEISFDGKPSEKVREALKALKFRWHAIKKVWYGYTDEETARSAIDGQENGQQETEQQTSTRKTASAAAKKPDQDKIRIYYNGIKIDGGKIIRCYYSLDNNAKHAESVSIGAMDYSGDLPRDLLPVTNGTDTYTDYFDKDHSYITPEHPLYKYFRFAAIKARLRDDLKTVERYTADLKKPERFSGQHEYYRKEVEKLQKRIEEAKKAEDPGQPTAADLEKINQQRQEAENARKAAEHEEQLRQREKVLNDRANGRRMIEETAKKYPIEENAPKVVIKWSENPAFYSWEDNELILSITAADSVLKALDDKVHAEERGYDKTAFCIIYTDENGEESGYEGRYDLGDNDGGLIQHIRTIGEWELTHEPFGKIKETPDETNDRIRFADYLQQYIVD